MQECSKLQDSSLFYSVLLCFGESMMNTNRLEMKHLSPSYVSVLFFIVLL